MTIHMIGQAHIDPVWLWGWQAGLDEVLATCRTACDLLDRYPSFIFTRGEAWCYQQVELLDPQLFARILQYIKSGRWEITGGWWLQPDCNFPSAIGFQRQIDLGKRYFLERFGQFPEVAYNVDSFGHNASLPRLIREAGQRYYVMMRPQEHELALPARLFRWRGSADGLEVTTFRIAGSYTSGPDAIVEERIRRACSELPDGITHTMCFYGVGDHGGGPTARLIEWIQAHRDAYDGCQLIFSSPRRFFAAIADQQGALPLVTGELQFHAIGCYSVQRAIKTGVLEAEHRLRQAEVMVGDSYDSSALHRAWEHVCFAQFHDILGGTSIPSAYAPIYARLGSAMTTAEETLQYGLRQKMRALSDDPLQRIVLYNASDSPYVDYAEVEPWLEYRPWSSDWRLLDEQGAVVPVQVLPQEALCGRISRLLFPVKLAANTMGIRRIAATGGSKPSEIKSATEDSIVNDLGVCVKLGAAGEMAFPGGLSLPLPKLVLIPDNSDTWTHVLDRYAQGPVESAQWHDPCLLHHGPLMSALLMQGTIGRSLLRAQWRVYTGLPFAELHLDVHWLEHWQLLKLVVPLAGTSETRLDGIPGGSLHRPQDGREYPLQDWTCCDSAGERFGIVCPEAFALDGTPRRLRFTLLRGAIMAHHAPHSGQAPHAVHADHGPHRFRWRFYGGSKVTSQLLQRDSLMFHRPLLTADLTRGMPRG